VTTTAHVTELGKDLFFKMALVIFALPAYQHLRSSETGQKTILTAVAGEARIRQGFRGAPRSAVPPTGP